MRSRLAQSVGSALVQDVKKNEARLTGDLLITDYDGHPAISMVWQVDRTPITDPVQIAAVIRGLVPAKPLPGLGVFFTDDIDAAFAKGELVLV